MKPLKVSKRIKSKNRYVGTYAFEMELLRKFEPMEEVEEELAATVGAGHHESLHKDGQTQVTSGENKESEQDGLPPLRFGTSTDPLPSNWKSVRYESLISFYTGNMAYMTADGNFFPAALPHDGYMDLSCIGGDVSRMESLKTIAAVQNNKVFDLERVSYRKVVGYRIIPRQAVGGGRGGGGDGTGEGMGKGERKGEEEGYISIDGERIPFEPFQAEVHRGLGRVLTKGGKLFEAPGVVPRGSMS